MHKNSMSKRLFTLLSLILLSSSTLFGAGVEVLNKGVGGNSTADMLRRIERDVIDQKPDLTIIMVGTNDMFNSKKCICYKEYQKNLSEIVDRVKGCGSDVMMLSSIPADVKYLAQRHDTSKYHDKAEKMGGEIRKIVKRIARREGCHFVDLYKEFQSRDIPHHNEDIYIRNEKNCGVNDGVHPTAAGYELMGSIIGEYFTHHKLAYTKIICFGDSITKGSGAKGGGTVTGENYPSYLNRKLNE